MGSVTKPRAGGGPRPEVLELATSIRLVLGRLTRRLRQQAGGGLTASSLSALASIERLGPVSLGALARVESVAPPTLTKVVSHLETLRLVRRRPDPSDRRSALVELSAAGKRTLVDARSAGAAYLVGRLARLTDEQRTALASALPLLDRLLEEDE